MLWWVSLASLTLSILSFLLFAIIILFPPTSVSGHFGEARAQGDLEAWAKVGKAVAKIIDSLVKQVLQL